jgi:hypothetical protein
MAVVQQVELTYCPGLRGTLYDGYFEEDPNWFDGATVIDADDTTDFSNRTTTNGTTWQWIGYFKPDKSDYYFFNGNSDDAMFLWIGDVAASGYTTQNALVTSYGGYTSPTVPLSAGVYYPVRIQWGHPVAPTAVGLSIYWNNVNNEETFGDWTDKAFFLCNAILLQDGYNLLLEQGGNILNEDDPNPTI